MYLMTEKKSIKPAITIKNFELFMQQLTEEEREQILKRENMGQLHEHFRAVEPKEKAKVRARKSDYVKKEALKILEKKKKKLVRNRSAEKSSFYYSGGDDRKVTPPTTKGKLRKLTEEILENAIVEVLETEPSKGLSTALAFLDKKKQLQVEDTMEQQISDKQKKYYNEVLKNVYQ